MSRSLKVLIVEDSPLDVELIIRELRRTDFEIQWIRVETEATFLDALETSPDLILSDYSLPQFNGLHAFQLMRDSGRDIPFILVSGTVGEDVAVEAMQMGVADYLLKDRLGRMGAAVLRALERSRLRRERHTAEALLRVRDRAIQAASQGIVIADALQPDCPIIFANRGFELISGYSVSETMGRNCRFLQGADTDPTAAKAIRDALAQERAITVELLNYRKDGTAFWNRLSITPVRDDNGLLTHFVGVQVDMTSQRSTEDQLRQSQKMDAIGQLAGGVAHDFNNLLTVINGYTEVLLAPLSPADATWEFLKEIQMAGVRAADLTKRLLAFGHQDIGTPESLNLNEAVTETVKLLGRLLGEDITIDVQLDPDLRYVWADRGQISQVLMNLAINARDAMQGSGRVSIHTENLRIAEATCDLQTKLESGDYVMLKVTDTGCGMPTNLLQRIFEPFFTTKAVGRGTGLGLAIVHGIVTQNQGIIDVTSSIGVGTQFRVVFPALLQPAAVRQPSSDRDLARSESETILIVEDDSALQRLAHLMLVNHGYNVLLAADGPDALRLISDYRGSIQLIITDMVMPGMSGQELANQVVKLQPTIRILFMSGYVPDNESREHFLRPEVSFLQKPFTVRSLALKVREVLDS